MTEPRKRFFTELPRPRLEQVILLCPVLYPIDDTPIQCMHLELSKDGLVQLCSSLAEENCEGCGRPICDQHASSLVLIGDDGVTYQLCEACGRLPHEDTKALRALCVRMNQAV